VGSQGHSHDHGQPRSATAILSSVQVTRELAIPHWLRPGEFVWTDQPVPESGPTVVVVNLRARVLSVYRAGVEIGRSSLIYGADNKPTPIGEFPVLEKDADHVSNLYDAPMPHMLRLTWDGVALHGSPELRDDLATRGCVGLPREFAAMLFDVVDVGDRVIVWDGVTTA
jgi:lipoprotein-anchoring transpeptidase ErfK/SrfK